MKEYLPRVLGAILMTSGIFIILHFLGIWAMLGVMLMIMGTMVWTFGLKETFTAFDQKQQLPGR